MPSNHANNAATDPNFLVERKEEKTGRTWTTMKKSKRPLYLNSRNRPTDKEANESSSKNGPLWPGYARCGSYCKNIFKSLNH